MTVQPAADRLNEHARDWNVAIHNIQTTETSLLAFGSRNDQRVVLKVARNKTEEWRSGEFLTAFVGKGIVRALEAVDGAVLLERLSPGNDLMSLSTSGRDDEATHIIAGIIEQMWSVSPSLAASAYIPVHDLASEFEQFRHSCDDLMPAGMIDKAELLFGQLCASQRDVRLLHGDLHHYNVLFDSQRGWVAIDPWGLLAEREYEVGASLRNPIAAPDLLASGKTLVDRLTIYQKRLGLDAERALRWAFSQSVLAALWPTEEGVGVDMRRPFIAAATAMMVELGI